MTNFPDWDLQIFEIISQIIDLQLQVLDLELQINEFDVRIYNFWNNLKNLEVQFMIFEMISKIWKSKSWISTQLQDWTQIKFFEMV